MLPNRRLLRQQTLPGQIERPGAQEQEGRSNEISFTYRRHELRPAHVGEEIYEVKVIAMALVCSKCDSPTRIQVQAVISAPGNLFHLFSKQNLRQKDVYLMGVLWETTDIICTNPDCNHIDMGYGNYVTKLEKEVKRLKSKYEPIQGEQNGCSS